MALTTLPLTAGDDSQMFVVRRNVSGGVDNRQHGSNIAENQMTVLYNADIGVPGESKKRPGSVQVGDDVSNDSVVALHSYERQGYNDQLVFVEDTHLYTNEAEASSSTAVKTDFTANTDVGIVSVKESGLTPDDVIMVSVAGNNWFRFHKASGGAWDIQDLGNTAGTGSDSPPASTVGCWFGNRFWVMKNDQLYFSSAYSADYSSAFDTGTDWFRLPVGEERALISTRDSGIVVFGKKAIWGIAPSITPDPTTDKPEPLVTNMGAVSKKGVVSVGDDIYFFAPDGLRSLRRTVQDKLQIGGGNPISYRLKTEFEAISWANIANLSMEYFDNKIFIAVPKSSTTYDTWIYYPAMDSFMIVQGWSPRCWAKYKVSGSERLYYGKHGNGVICRAWYGYTDEGTSTTNGTAINYQEEGRKEDLGQPLIKKNGGVVKIKAYASGNYDLTVSISLDDQAYNTLGTINLQGNAPTLPVSLPFTLADTNLVEESFHLDDLGGWYQARLRIVHNAANGSDDIKVFEREIVSYPEEFEDE